MASKDGQTVLGPIPTKNVKTKKTGRSVLPAVLGILILLGAVLYKPLELRFRVLGVTRTSIPNIHGEEIRIIPDTLHVEDLHLHEPSGLLFGASEENEECRFKWWPPIAVFDDPATTCQGTIIVIDPKTFTTKRLTLSNFSGPFITHGIDIYSPPSDPTSLFIFAVNHLPNPSRTPSSPPHIPQARSQIELFHHTLHTSSATHLRSISHPLISTPNDILALSDHEIYITNDHHYRDGRMRVFEDLAFQSLAPWSTTIHIALHSLSPSPAGNASAALTASVALRGLHNNNGLGHGRSDDEILIGRAAGGALVFARPKRSSSPSSSSSSSPSSSSSSSSELEVLETVQLDSAIDNPSYFRDPFAEETGRDASGFVLAGLARAADWVDERGRDPVFVWFVAERRAVGEQSEAGKQSEALSSSSNSKFFESSGPGSRWNKTLLFSDDSSTIRSASTAVLVAIDPKVNGGRKQGWLFVTGGISRSVVAGRVDL